MTHRRPILAAAYANATRQNRVTAANMTVGDHLPDILVPSGGGFVPEPITPEVCGRILSPEDGTGRSVNTIWSLDLEDLDHRTVSSGHFMAEEAPGEVITAVPSAQSTRFMTTRTTAVWKAVATACERDDFRPRPGALHEPARRRGGGSR